MHDQQQEASQRIMNMKRMSVVYVLAVLLITQILLSTVVNNEPSFKTTTREQFDVSKIAQNQAVNVATEKWMFNSSTKFLEISMRKASAFERSLYDIGVPINTLLVGNTTLHTKLYASNLDVNDSVIRAFVTLVNETHTIELNYCVGREVKVLNPDPNLPTNFHLYTSVSNSSNCWITIDRDIVGDLVAKNVSIKTDGNWRISKLCVGGILYQENELAAISMLVDVDQTYLALGATKVYPSDASINPVILLIAGLFVFSCMVLFVDNVMFRRKNKTKLQKNDKAFLILILQAALFVRLILLDYTQLASDEAIYTYTPYLLTKGILPYKEVFMAHPPLNFYITVFFMEVFKPSYPSIRLLNVVIFLATIIMTYLLSKVVLGRLNGKYSLLATALYALYPSWFTYNSTASSLENLLTLFTLLSTFFYVLYHRNNKNRYLLISGFSGGLTLLVTMRAAFFLISLIATHLIYIVWLKKQSQLFRDGLLFTSGFALPIGCTVGLLAVSNVLQYFYLDVFTYQFSIFRMALNDRLWYLGQYLAAEWPLLLPAGFGTYLTVKTVKQTRNISTAIPGFVFFSNFLFFSSFGFLMHYLQFLSPFLSILSILGIKEARKIIRRDTQTRMRSKAVVCIFLVVLCFFGYLTATSLYQVASYLRKNPYDKVNYYAGKRIASMTNPSDYIWSGDAAIGFFSQRIIVAPSSDFRFIGCSDSIIGFDYGKDRGAEMKGYNDGFVTVEDFIQAWESKHVTVLVFIMKKGWIPYVDPFLWNGYRGHTGVAEYVSTNYELQEVVIGEDVPYIYYIWVRRE